MAISYNKLWKLLIDKKMSKADLRKAAGIAPNTMSLSASGSMNLPKSVISPRRRAILPSSISVIDAMANTAAPPMQAT